MPARPLLSWEPGRGRWRGQHQGRRLGVSCRQLKQLGYLDQGARETKLDSYQAANRWWHDVITKMPDGHDRQLSVADSTLGRHVDTWIAVQEARWQAGEISHPELVCRRYQVRAFELFLGRARQLATIGPADWRDFHQHLLTRVSMGELSRTYAAKITRTSRQLLTDLITDGLVPPLANLNDTRLVVRSTPPAVVILTPAEARRVIDAATAQLQLHLLLMANCGMTQQDISDLHPSEVDWERRTITRKRSKTRGHENVPTVTYRLWDWTHELLVKYRSTHPDHLLLTKSGRVWVNREGQNADHVKACWRHLKARLHLDYTPKVYRKTSASLLASHPVHGRFDWYFLGHSPATIKDRHYVRPDQALFDEAIAWLATQYGLTCTHLTGE